MANERVLFADTGLTVHIAHNKEPVVDDQGNEFWDIYSQTLAPGQTVPFENLPKYLQDSLEAGEIPGARIVSLAEAKKLNKEAEKIRNIASQTIPVEGDVVLA